MATNLALGFPCPVCDKAKAAIMSFVKDDRYYVTGYLLHCLSCEHTWNYRLPDHDAELPPK